jgi:hypothetical protein
MSALGFVFVGVLMAPPTADTTPQLVPTKLTLAEVVENVRENEKLYRTIEMQVQLSTRLVGWKGFSKTTDPNAKKGESSAIHTSSVHVILDGARFLQETDWSSIGAETGKLRGHTLVNACDGKQTFTIYKGGARIEEGRVPHDDFVHPNTFLYLKWNFPTPFSNFLTMPDDVRRNMRWTVLGEEAINGLRCVKLQFEQVLKDEGTNYFEAFFWLAVDRNYLPIKYESITPRLHPQLVHGYGSVTALKEHKSGIWVPEFGESTTHEYKALKEGKQIPNQSTQIHVEKVTLNKPYQPEVFRPKIPRGSLVQKMKNGKIIETYREGEKK